VQPAPSPSCRPSRTRLHSITEDLMLLVVFAGGGDGRLTFVAGSK